mmetsp:Transcript_7620/g.21650  ORF Transcript_7620/g.21650 Transcript_7620/m.21650 type:complete len:261 (+) Transcript_7620:124-906(+)|eukprot:CAMPEP_0119140950 /NCGR_PEP_ID=MMETSP1310-20130426/30084_1 /TAXON_ID=464262 /ORGANISM="Genus nov. species nov., Strain RCC2339" /LENGTH=260 /DNA_ID=CAMNT_0007132357 /DNA_START=107 /DNA_END=886 /DNA_ORIENTATION=+
MAAEEGKFGPELYTVENLDDEKKEKLSSFLKLFEKDAPSEGCALRFLVARQFDTDLAKTMYDDTQAWRAETKPEQFIEKTADFEHITKKKLVVEFPFSDQKGRPILCVNGQRMDKNWDAKHKETATLHMMEKMCAQVGDTGQFIMVWDMQNIGWSNVDYGILQYCIQILQNYYPERMGLCFVTNTNWIFNVAWGIVAPWLDPRTRAKIIICNGNGKEELLSDQIGLKPEQLPKTFGGTYDDTDLMKDESPAPEAKKGWLW